MKRRTFAIFVYLAAAHFCASSACVCGGAGYLEGATSGDQRWRGAVAAVLTFPAAPLCGWLGLTSAHLILPLLLANSLFFATAATILHAIFQWRPPPRPGLCPSCGYDLRASKDRCPECGEPAQEKVGA